MASEFQVVSQLLVKASSLVLCKIPTMFYRAGDRPTRDHHADHLTLLRTYKSEAGNQSRTDKPAYSWSWVEEMACLSLADPSVHLIIFSRDSATQLSALSVRTYVPSRIAKRQAVTQIHNLCPCIRPWFGIVYFECSLCDWITDLKTESRKMSSRWIRLVFSKENRAENFLLKKEVNIDDSKTRQEGPP